MNTPVTQSQDSDADDKSAWLVAKEVFMQVVAQPVGQRDNFIRNLCGEGSIAAQVHQLLKWHESDADFLKPITRVSPEADPASHGNEPVFVYGPEKLDGLQLGGFELGAVIGQGGMGTVYEARQLDPDRPAAVKILRADSVYVGMEGRLAREAAILARLDHPGIARIYSAGTLDQGATARPWFAMELIRGPTLLEYARLASIDRRQRLELLTKLCEAVQHAHQRNIVHRDLKPENILVRTLGEDSQGNESCQPVVLDFGVARLSTALAPFPQATAAGQLIGTVAYMSPEQFAGRPELVDARSDVYALGVIGYELLAGQPPHDRHKSSIIEVVQQIASEQPKKLRQLDRTLGAELETLFYKAVEPDVDRRYQSVSELSSDIRAYLNHQPIQARPATLAYRLQKFVRRNPILVGGLATTFLAMAIGIFAYSREAVRAQRAEREARESAMAAQYEADKTKAVNEFLTNDFMMRLLESINSSKESSSGAAIELASKASSNLSSTYQDKPILEAAVRNELGTIFYNLHAADKAAEQFELALQLWDKSLGSDHVDTLKAVNNLGQARMLQGRSDEAEPLYRRALTGRIASLGDNHPATAATLNNLAEVLRARREFSEVESYQKRALEILIETLGENHRDTITTMANYGSTLVQTGRSDEGKLWHQRAYESAKVGLGDNHVITLHAGSRLSQTLLSTQQGQQARELLLTVLKGFENIYGTQSAETLAPRRLLARAHQYLGDNDAAIKELETASTIAQTQGDSFKEVAKRISRELEVARGNNR